MARLLVRLLLAAGLLLGPGLAISGAANPFIGNADPAAPEPAGVERAWGPVAAVGRALLTFQREANRLIARHMKAIRDGQTSVPLLLGMALAFAYGVVHALGPGHGKLVVVSYFLAREARIGRGLLMGLQIAVCHVLSAMVVVALADLLLRQAFGGAPAEVAGVRLASYGLIALIGLVMLAQAVRRSRLRRAGIAAEAACCGHRSDRSHAGDGHHAPGEVRDKAQQGALSIGVGLVPCTGSMLILLYAMANDILYAGMLLVTAIAAGMALTMGGLGILSVVARRAVAGRVAASSGGEGQFAAAMDYAGALAITLIGGALLWAAL
jgi:ABC-type nickel/cobalt efflux system permease component RcnA